MVTERYKLQHLAGRQGQVCLTSDTENYLSKKALRNIGSLNTSILIDILKRYWMEYIKPVIFSFNENIVLLIKLVLLQTLWP